MTAKKDWKNQERNYRKMIKRLGAGADARQEADGQSRCGTRWARSTGRASRTTRRRSRRSRSACSWIRTRRARHQILAELYQLSGPETYEQAIKAYRQLIKTTHGLRPDGGVPEDAAQAAHGAAPVRPARGAWRRAASFLRKARRRGDSSSTSSTGPRGSRAPRARLTEELWQARLPPRRGSLHLGGVRGGQPVGGGGARQGAQGLGPQAQGQARRRERPAAVQQGVQLRQPGAGRAAAGAVPAAGIAGRDGSGERAREGAAGAVVGRVLGPAAGPAREGAGVRHRQAADVHAAAITSCAGRTWCRRSPS